MFIKLFGKSHKDLTDEELVLKYKNDADEKAASVLFERYTLMVFGVCMKYLKNEEESKDATLEIFQKLLSSLKKHPIENFRAWLHTVSRNFCLMELRKHKSHAQTENIENLTGDSMENMASLHLYTNDSEEEQEAQIQKLGTALESLNAEQRVCLELFFLEEKSYQEITNQTGYSISQVKSYIQNGKRNLKIKMEKLSILLAFWILTNP